MLITYKQTTTDEVQDNNEIDELAFLMQQNYTPTIRTEVSIKTFSKDKALFTVDQTVINSYIIKLIDLANRMRSNLTNPIEEYYEIFRIPKASGGFRTISAPQYPLKGYLDDFKNLLQYDFKCLAHNSAYAYVPSRSTVDAVKKHQENNSNWFLKIDIHDFFGSHTKEFILESLKELYPFAYIMEDEAGMDALQTIIEFCMLSGGLPQGSPVSPLLTNLCMVKFDYLMETNLSYFQNAKIVYTRYADDMIISSFYKFKWRELVQELNNLLTEHTPFTINETKTRFGSKSGRNWNLGLMYNKDGNVTVGWKNKKEYKHKLYNFLKATERWNGAAVQEFNGLTAYYLMVEKEYFTYLIRKYEIKAGITLKAKTRWHENGM